MKVADLFKHRGQPNNKYSSDFMQRMSPVVREYWGEIVNKANSRHLFTRLRDFHSDAVNDAVQGYDEAPQEIIDEDELALLQRMKELKKSYRAAYSQLKNSKHQVSLIQ